MSSHTELQPDVADVLQEEDVPTVTVPVCITDQTTPVRTQGLPRKGGASFTKTVGATSALQVLWVDHRRARARIVSTSALLLAFNKSSAVDPSTMTIWPASVPFETQAATEVWVMAGTGTAQVGVCTELWAEGE